MGGIGSGRRSHCGTRNKTEDSRPLDIRRLQRAGVLMTGRSFGWQWTLNGEPVADIQVRVEIELVVLVYRYRRRGDSEWQDVEQPVRISRTPCTYGGTRPWWMCPSCGRLVAVLYGPGKLYACRHCCKLAYSCQSESADDRAARRANRIRRRLGWEPGIFNGTGDKPKGMRCRTFERLLANHDAFVGVSLAGMAERLGLMHRSLTGVLDDLGCEG